MRQEATIDELLARRRRYRWGVAILLSAYAMAPFFYLPASLFLMVLADTGWISYEPHKILFAPIGTAFMYYPGVAEWHWEYQEQWEARYGVVLRSVLD